MGTRSKLEYRLAWARTHLKMAEAVENSARGVWAITDVGRALHADGEKAIRTAVARAIATPKDEAPVDGSLFEVDDRDETLETGSEGWQDRLLNELPRDEAPSRCSCEGVGVPDADYRLA